MSRVWGPFENEHVKRVQTLLQPKQQHLYQIHWSLWRHLTYQKSLLVVGKILNLFVNTLAADDKHSLLNTDSLTTPIQMQLSFVRIFFSTFEIYFKFQKKDHPHSWCISEFTDSQKRG